jgi:hypothetical protein
MRLVLLLALAVLPLSRPPHVLAVQDEHAWPLADVQRFELEVEHWEGTFGTYLHPATGDVVVLDLARLGTRELLALRHQVGGTFDLGFLAVEEDTLSGGPEPGWTRRVVLKGRHAPDHPLKTILELVIRYEVERFAEQDGRRVRASDNVTNVLMRVHTLREDETLQEYGRARAYHDRDHGVRIPDPGK